MCFFHVASVNIKKTRNKKTFKIIAQKTADYYEKINFYAINHEFSNDKTKGFEGNFQFT